MAESTIRLDRHFVHCYSRISPTLLAATIAIHNRTIAHTTGRWCPGSCRTVDSVCPASPAARTNPMNKLNDKHCIAIDHSSQFFLILTMRFKYPSFSHRSAKCLDPYNESFAVQSTNASSPSKNTNTKPTSGPTTLLFAFK